MTTTGTFRDHRNGVGIPDNYDPYLTEKEADERVKDGDEYKFDSDIGTMHKEVEGDVVKYVNNESGKVTHTYHRNSNDSY